MGLFDFLKPKKNPMAELLQKPGVRSAMAGMELEYLQKQVANLRSVGRKEDAKKAVSDFLAKYAREHKGEVTSRIDLARISYSVAYRTLPDLVHARWAEFCDLWSGGLPFPMFLAIKGASDQGKSLSLNQIQEFKYYQGDLDSNTQYFLIEFPTPPEQGEGPNIEALMAALAAGKKPSTDVVPVLGPFFAAVIFDSAKNVKHLYILGQSPGGGTTLRFVAAGGVNANCGPGPEPTSSNFLQAVKANLRR
jgi:hypothetical protein